MTVRIAASVATMIALSACATATTIPGESDRPSGRSLRATSFRGDDRVVIPSMTVVQAVDVSDRYTFIATVNGLGVYDRRLAYWLPPFTIADGWPANGISAFMADPGDPSAVWFASENSVYRYRAVTEEVTRTLVQQRVTSEAIFVDARDRGAGLIIRTGFMPYPIPRTVRGVVKNGENTYIRVSPAGFAQPIDPWSVDPVSSRDTMPRIFPQSLRAVYAQFPSLQDYVRLLTRDDGLRSWPVTTGAVSPRESEAWIGTAGSGLFRVEPLFSKGEHLPFGLLSDGAGAIGIGAGGVWIGGIGRPNSGRDGLTFAQNDLKQWRWIDGGAASPFLGTRVAAIVPYGSTVWAATDRGVIQADNDGGNARLAWDGGNGLPLSLAPTNDGVWVGTSRGLSFMHLPVGTARATVDAPIFEGVAVRALVRRSDTLWIGSDAGLLVLTPGATGARPLRSATGDSRFAQSVVAIATSDSVVVASTTSDDILFIHTRTGALIEAMSSLTTGRTSRVHGLAIDARSLWIAGESGVLVVNRLNNTQRMLSANVDLAGPAFGIALTPEFAWIASRDAAVRIRRSADGTVR